MPNILSKKANICQRIFIREDDKPGVQKGQGALYSVQNNLLVHVLGYYRLHLSLHHPPDVQIHHVAVLSELLCIPVKMLNVHLLLFKSRHWDHLSFPSADNSQYYIKVIFPINVEIPSSRLLSFLP